MSNKKEIRHLIEREMTTAAKDFADRLEAAIIAYIREEFAFEDHHRGFTARTLEQRLTEPYQFENCVKNATAKAEDHE